MWNNCIWQISKIYFFLTVDNRHTNFINVKLKIINLGEIYSFIPEHVILSYFLED